MKGGFEKGFINWSSDGTEKSKNDQSDHAGKKSARHRRAKLRRGGIRALRRLWGIVSGRNMKTFRRGSKSVAERKTTDLTHKEEKKSIIKPHQGGRKK